MVEDFSLLHFLPLAIEEQRSVERVVSEIDKATGFVFIGLAQAGDTPYPPECLYGAASHEGKASDLTQHYQEKCVPDLEEQQSNTTAAGLQAVQERKRM